MMEFISEETLERALAETGVPPRQSPFRALELRGVTDTSLSFSWEFLFDESAKRKALFESYKCTASDSNGLVKVHTLST